MNIVNVLKALANEKRFQILEYLKEPEKHFLPDAQPCNMQEGICVGLIERKIGLSQSTVSQYLAQLQQVGLIHMERRGQWTFCQLNRPLLQQFIQELNQRL
jgi:ArsR family transcriptional regulator